MSKEKQTLKSQNLKTVILFIIYCLAIYIVFFNNPTDFWTKLNNQVINLNSKDGLFMLFSPLISIILTSVFSSNIKECISLWKLKNPLPGHRAFTEYAPKDTRIDNDVLKTRLGSIPTDETEQNKTWYKIYKGVSELYTIQDSHKYFLLFRELTSVAFLFLIVTPFSFVFTSKPINHTILYTIIIAAHYIVLAICTQNTGKRLVCNVLAEYTSTSTTPPNSSMSV